MAGHMRTTSIAGALAVAVILAAPASAAADTDALVGLRGPSYAEGYAGEAVTDGKPESKLWFHAGSWWASMASGGVGGARTIHRLDDAEWIDTETVVDPRAATAEDVLSVGSTLYVLSRAVDDAQDSFLRRFSHQSGSYRLDDGFPVVIPASGVEAATVARDTTGVLWITFEEGTSIKTLHSLEDDGTWTGAQTLPFPEAEGVSSDEISAVVGFRDADGPAIGVMWSHQGHERYYFAVHRDGRPLDEWTLEVARTEPWGVDDHIDLATAGGQVFAAVKTSATAKADPRIRLLARGETGIWSAHTVATVQEKHTRPIVVVSSDPEDEAVYVFMSRGPSGRAGAIEYRRSPLDRISFLSELSTLIRGNPGQAFNNATSMKQVASGDDGIVVLAAGAGRYWFNRTPPPRDTPERSARDARAADDATIDGGPGTEESLARVLALPVGLLLVMVTVAVVVDPLGRSRARHRQGQGP